MSLLKVMLDTKSLFIDEHARLLVMRDTPEVVRMAEKLLLSLDLEDSEVMMEVDIVEITRSKLQEIGIKYPNQVNLNILAPAAAAGTTAVQTLATLAFDRVHTGISSLGATINLKREDSHVNILSSPRIRARNYEKAKVHIGDRVPVFTNAVTPIIGGTGSVVTGSVTYLDVGLKFDVEPTIYWDDEVSMKLNLEVSSIVKEVQSGSSLSYQVGTRAASTVLRLRDGETQVLAGLISDADRETATKVPGLSSFPILGRLFSSEKSDKNKQEIALSITPHVIRHGRRPNIASSEILYGTESSRGIPLTVKMSDNDRKPIVESKGAVGLPATVTMGAAIVGNPSEGAARNEAVSATVSDATRRGAVRRPAGPPVAVTPGASQAVNSPESPPRSDPSPVAEPEGVKKGVGGDPPETPAQSEPIPAGTAESAGPIP
jgi:general secretion pathway protein D